MDKYMGVRTARKLDTLECLQRNLTDQRSCINKDWDETRCNFDWGQDGMEVLFNETEKVVYDSIALVEESLVKTEEFRTAVMAQTTCHHRINPTVSTAEVKRCFDLGGV